jgi:hypothetical protein
MSELDPIEMTSQQLLVSWFRGNSNREAVAAIAENHICRTRPDIERGSEEFYRLVLERASQ